MPEGTQPTARLRASLANAAFAVEDRIRFGGFEAVRGVLDAVKWPFEQLAWAAERHLIWPLQDRTGDWDRNVQAAGAAAVVVVAIGVGVLGLLWAAGGNGSPSREPAAPSRLPLTAASDAKTAAATPLLHGAVPVFKAGLGAGEAAGTTKTATDSASGTDAPGAATSAAELGEPAGPAGLQVARRFADAFVLYEIGKGADKARTAFHETATPELARSLLRRPPRLPAGVEVPQAKVVNVVAGPSHGGVYPISVSLLRVGVTSELRLNMQKQDKASAAGTQGKVDWQVTDVTG